MTSGSGVSGWRLWHYQDVLIHIVENEELSNLLHDDLARKGSFLSKPEELPARIVQGDRRTETMFDLGGLAHIGEPKESFIWAGLNAVVPSRQVASIIRRLDALPLRRFEPATKSEEDVRFYYKLKMWHWAWVMTPTSYADLVRQLLAIEQAATSRAAGFFAQKARRDREKESR